MANLYDEETGVLTVEAAEEQVSESEKAERERMAEYQVMMNTKGWKFFMEDLREFHEQLMRTMLTTSIERLPKAQADAKAFDEVLRYVETLHSRARVSPVDPE